jgi:hypothetical protein
VTLYFITPIKEVCLNSVNWQNLLIINCIISSCGLVQCEANSLLLSSIMLFTVGARRYSRVLQHIKKCDMVSSIPVDNCCIIINTLINLHDPIYL